MIYALMSVTAFRHNEQIVFKISIPLLDRETYNVYEATAVPTRVENKLIWIQPTTEYLLTNYEHVKFVNMDKWEHRNCKEQDENTLH